MPLPKKEDNKDDYISKFMSNPEMIRKYPNDKQRYAVAINEYINLRKRYNK